MIRNIFSQYKYVFVWGTGEYLKKYRDYLPKMVDGYIDNDVTKNGIFIGNTRIYSPEVLNRFPADLTLIVICNSYYDEISSQICGLGEYRAIHIEDVVMISDAEKNMSNAFGRDEDRNVFLPGSILSVAGIHALFQINGCNRFIDGQIRVLNNHSINSLEIAPIRFVEDGRKSIGLLAVRGNGQYKGIVRLERILQSIDSFKGVIVHSLYYDHELIGEILDKLDSHIPVLYYTHDYYCICANRFLIKNEATCTDENGKLKCEECELKEVQDSLRQFHRKIFAAPNVRVISPTTQVRDCIKEVYPEACICVEPHLNYKTIARDCATKTRKIRVAFLGGRFTTKGWDYFNRLSSDYAELYDFYYFGSSGDNLNSEITFVRTTLENTTGMVGQLKDCCVDVACILSLVPETYSYTFYEALEAGCFIVTTDKSGNVNRSVKKMNCGRVFCSYEEMSEWFSSPLSVLNTITKKRIRIQNVTDNDHFVELLRYQR